MMLAKMVPKKPSTTQQKGLNLCHSKRSTSMMPAAPPARVTSADTASWQKSTKEGAGTWWTVYLLMICTGCVCEECGCGLGVRAEHWL